MRRPSYSRSQWMGLLWIVLPCVMVVAGVAVHDQGGPQAWWVFGGVSLFQLVLLLMLGRLTIELDETQIRWRFGVFGWPRWQIDLADIVDVRPVRTRFIDGWGIRRTREGWLYNASGFDAVRLQLRDGRVVRLGSDEPQRLLAFIEARLPGRH